MKFELEQEIRNEARYLRQVGVLTWDRRLIASGLHPEKWSHEIEAEAAEVDRERGANTAALVAEASTPVDAFMRDPDLYWSTRTAPGEEIIGRRSSEFGLKSFDEKTNTIDCVWTTGAAVLRQDCQGLYNEVLDVTTKAVRLSRLNAGASFLNSHRNDDLAEVLGSVVLKSAKIEAGKGVCRLLLSKAAGCADTIGNIRDGVIRNCSVGYIVHASTWFDDQSGIPTCRVTDWEPYEISAVSVPADPGAQFRMETAPAGTGRYSDPNVRAAVARMKTKARRLGLRHWG